MSSDARAGVVGALGILLACVALAHADVAPATRQAGSLEAVVVTELGEFVIRLLPEVAPRHVRHFVQTARSAGYDGTAFHRIIPGGIVQGGDPFSKDPRKKALYGKGGLGLLKAEISPRPFVRGAVGAARRPSSLDSGGSQFFVCLTDQPVLNGKYTLFGEVVSGLDVLDQIGATPVEGDRPTRRLAVRRVTIREAQQSPAVAPGNEPAAEPPGPASGARSKE
jgi:cyclophilin family peptidyl-prolyl cis-trans isomerase